MRCLDGNCESLTKNEDIRQSTGTEKETIVKDTSAGERIGLVKLDVQLRQRGTQPRMQHQPRLMQCEEWNRKERDDPKEGDDNPECAGEAAEADLGGDAAHRLLLRQGDRQAEYNNAAKDL